MIEKVQGKVVKIETKFLVIQVAGLGLKFFVARPEEFELGKEVFLETCMMWNQDKGPSLFGFNTDHEKELFLMLIECPKIGPQTAMQILCQLSAENLLNSHSGDLRRLSPIGYFPGDPASKPRNQPN